MRGLLGAIALIALGVLLMFASLHGFLLGCILLETVRRFSHPFDGPARPPKDYDP